MKIQLFIPILPHAKQSMRVYEKNGRVFTHKDPKVKKAEDEFKKLALMMLPKPLKKFEKFVRVKSLVYHFPPLKSTSKYKMRHFEAGECEAKNTKPDLDNLNKFTFDALKGIVYDDDAIINYIGGNAKVYSKDCGIYIEMEGM